ncbi:sensor histidine kinase [Magnetospirillum gryphiswaldense]|uniref:histidine kinase n=1 Tax=Magnetospirillum gryphiswaldense TaxID=55518 RepID=A4U3G0_9PROT|nr:ATP-binding protein [Magnetospirillum gryphiswaldense]AVM75759.1 Phytochrome-like protein cph1 [Magnetospirillum gryphiswaldense MSR-1]AVM79662.1 Phytochrome-like protein cph1 [Magnetospirillum gryphiswaldense]CAM77417.1 signal transduction histidine kinase [Magnetospirillum gryphiswaldense MSR-1]
MAPVDALRLRRVIVTYAILAMVTIGIVVAILAITPLALRLREDALAALRHELTLKVMAGGEVAARAVNLAQQVTSRTVIRQKLESYNQGETNLNELQAFTADKLGDALNLSPDLLGIIRFAADGEKVAVLGKVAGAENMGPLTAARLHLSLAQGGDSPVLVVAAPIIGRGGVLAGTDLVVVSGQSLHAVVDEVRALRGRTKAALVDPTASTRVILASHDDFALDAAGTGLVGLALERGQVQMEEHDGVVLAAAALPGTGWVLLLRLPAGEATAAVDTLLLWVMVAAGIVIALGVWGLRWLLQPLTGAFIVHSADMTRQIAELRQAQSELAAKSHDLALSNAELQEYAYAASHDLQEPVRTIIGFAQLLERRYRGQMGPEADEFIAFIVEGAERMRRQINDLLSYARLGRGEPVQEIVDMDKVAAEAVQALAAAIASSGAMVEIEPLPMVKGGRDALSRLLQNLMANGLKFTKPGEVAHIRVSAMEGSDPNWAEFIVRDHGIGIAPEYHDRIFRMFERLHPRGQYEGSGIGLAICRKVVEMHGGRIWVESQLGEGTAFHFLLPKAYTKSR